MAAMAYPNRFLAFSAEEETGIEGTRTGDYEMIRSKFHQVLFILIAAFMCLPNAAFGQFPGPPDDDTMGPPPSGQIGPMGPGPRQSREFSPEQRLKRMTSDLNLTADQRAKVKPILEKEQKEMEALRTDSKLSPQEKREKFRGIHEASLNQIRPLLNDSQRKEFDSMQQQIGPRGGRPPEFSFRDRGRPDAGGPNGGPPGASSTDDGPPCEGR